MKNWIHTQHSIYTALLVAALVISWSALAASAQPQEKWRLCAGSNVDARIAACGVVINSGTESGASLATALFNRGIALYDQRQYDRAIREFDEVLRLSSEDAEAFYNRGNAWYHQSVLDRAIQNNDQAEPVRDADSQLDRAIHDYDQAIRLKPDYADAFNNRGIAHYDRHHYERAIQDFDQAIRLKPHLAEAFNNRCLAYLKLNQLDRARQDFDETIRLNQNYGNALVTVGLGASEPRGRPRSRRPN